MIVPLADIPAERDSDVIRVLGAHVTGTQLRKAIAAGNIDPTAIFVALGDHQRVVGAIATTDLGGAQIDIHLPRAESIPIMSELITFAIESWRRRGGRQFQILLAPHADDSARPDLRKLGFRFITKLELMMRPISSADATVPAVRLKLFPCKPDCEIFALAVLATYEGSLDVPELNGTRSADEILASFGVGSPLDLPGMWIATSENDALGVLALCSRDGREFDLAYMGIVPAARGLGFGTELARIAICVAAHRGATVLHLSVDGRNHSARRIYAQLGFEVHDRRAVWLNF
jgi:mycothiol synthase